jgi:alpha-L-arabinofuranosidase
MIRFNSHQSFGTPSYWVQQLFPTHVGNRLVKTDLEWNIPRETMQNASPVSVGLATWKTQSSYRNAQVIVEGTSIPLASLKEWKRGNTNPKFEGTWSTDADGTLRQSSNAEESMVVCPETFSATHYTYKVQARKDSGAEGFMVVFNYIDEKNFDWFNVGGWGNTRSSVEQTWKGGRHTLSGGQNNRIDEGRWYDLQVDVDGDSLTCLVDGKVIFTGKKNNGQMHGVYANSTLDEKTRTLYTKVVNLCSKGTTGTLQLSGGSAATAEMVRLAGMTGEDENTMQYPNNIVPRPAIVQKAEGGKKLIFDVAPFSVNIITTKLQ